MAGDIIKRAEDLPFWSYLFDELAGDTIFSAINSTKDDLPRAEFLDADIGLSVMFLEDQGDVFGQVYDTLTGTIVDP